MSDYTALKRLAEAANAVMGDVRVEMTIAGERGPNQAEIDAVTAFMGMATPAAVLALIAESERLNTENTHLILLECYGSTAQAAINLLAERDQLKAENAGLKTGYEAYERVNAELKAENEALRDDLEQVQYDADAWRNPEESVWVQVFLGEGDTPFISAVHGAICVEQIALIQGEVLENAGDYFEHGPGFYVFECRHCEAHYDNVGMTEPAHWEIDFSECARFPWADEQAEMSKGELS